MSRQLPDGWRELELGDVGTTYQGLQGKSKVDFGRGKPYIPYLNIFQNGRINPNQLDRVSINQSENQNPVQVGDSFFTTSSETAQDVATSSTLLDDVGECYLNSFSFGYRYDHTKLLPVFAQHLFRSASFRRTVTVLAQGATRFNISKVRLLQTSVALPPLPEQKAIAGILQKWDEAIEKTEALIFAKQKQFEWLIKQLTYNARCPKARLDSFLTELSIRNEARSIERVLSVTNKDGFVLPEKQFKRRVASADLSNYKIVRRGQYAYNPARINVGSIARLDKWTSGVLSPMYTVFELDATKVISDYFVHWLFSNEARQRIKNSAQGSVRETVHFSDLCAITISMPSLAEQKRIAHLLNTAQHEIGLLKQLADRYRTQKSGLMQKLLTGEWRV